MQVLHLPLPLGCIKTNLGLQQNFAYHTEEKKSEKNLNFRAKR